MSRATYFREYYYRTRARRLALARQHEQAKRWCAWLLKELGVLKGASSVGLRPVLMAIYRSDIAPWLRNAIALALVSGQRREDVARATFADVRDGAWWVVQGKTKARVAIPLELRLDAFRMSLEDVVRQCRGTEDPHERTIRNRPAPGNVRRLISSYC
jgi:integrase